MFPAGVPVGSSDNPGHSSTHLILWRRFTRVQDEGHRPDAAGGPTGGRVRCHCSLPAVVVPEEGPNFILFPCQDGNTIAEIWHLQILGQFTPNIKHLMEQKGYLSFGTTAENGCN